MKTFFFCVSLLASLLVQPITTAQPVFSNSSSPGPAAPRSVLFGSDIVISDQPDKKQNNTDICYAFNGWLFAAFAYNYSSLYQRVMILKSVDNGVTWTLIHDKNIFFKNEIVPRIDIVTTGDSLSNLKLVLGVTFFDTVYNTTGVIVAVHNGTTGEFEHNLLYLESNGYPVRDVALASDALLPAANLHPGSVGILYSRRSYSKDSVVFLSSTNGGASVTSRRLVTMSDNTVKKVALSYGSSSSLNGGCYFAVWSKSPGHIYTSHTPPGIIGSLTTPMNLDSLQSSWINQCSNPVISCQAGNMNNSVGNLTEVVLFEKYNPQTGDTDIAGCYNLQASGSANYTPFELAATSGNEVQPNVVFNPFDSTFVVTYFDETAKKLPCLKNGFNMVNPDAWTLVNAGYNDNTNLTSPFPKVSLNTSLKQVVTAWAGQRPGGYGVALFDASYNWYTGVGKLHWPDQDISLRIFPNPCQDKTTLQFSLARPDVVSVTICTLEGNQLLNIPPSAYSAGDHTTTIDISGLHSGCYILTLKSGTSTDSGKFIVIH